MCKRILMIQTHTPTEMVGTADLYCIIQVPQLLIARVVCSFLVAMVAKCRLRQLNILACINNAVHFLSSYASWQISYQATTLPPEHTVVLVPHFTEPCTPSPPLPFEGGTSIPHVVQMTGIYSEVTLLPSAVCSSHRHLINCLLNIARPQSSLQ